jgi:VWFA-related protein
MPKPSLRALLAALLIGILPGTGLAAFAQQQPQEKKQEPQEEYAISLEVPVVTVDVVVTDNRGNYISGLKKENFRILEDGVPQTVTNFAPTEAPITCVILLEFSKLYFEVFAYTATEWAQVFLSRLKQNDWAALISYDLKTRIEVDFTQNKFEIQRHLARMYFPGFSEANLFDALMDTLDRLEDVKGKKSILILASGMDTFSKHTLDDVLKRVKRTDVTIFSVGVGRAIYEYLEMRGLGASARLSYLQGENQLSAFARITGGRSWFPRFYGQISGVMSEVADSLRNQYSLGYTPSTPRRDGKYHKIKVELVGTDGQPLEVRDQNNKKVKYVVYAREGYQAPKGTVGGN